MWGDLFCLLAECAHSRGLRRSHEGNSKLFTLLSINAHSLWLGGRATEVARATESVSKSKILPILENVEKAALFGAQLFCKL